MNGGGTRNSMIRQWVRQPPAEPNIQYLRDAEWGAAQRQLGKQGRVLDIASESRVTNALDADHVTRLDFSREAHEYAQDLLEGAVDRFDVTSPTDPALPFEDDEFDATVCIGPYDWRFLDVNELTAELHRVTDPDGRFVVSVPTPNSPYSMSSKNRYFSPAEFIDLFAPDWRLVEKDLLFQYPYPIHPLLNRLPPSVQRWFTDKTRYISEQLTSRDLWGLASYIVASLQPLDYTSYLERGLESLFRPVTADGFWDPEEGKIIRALDYHAEDNSLTWSPDDSIQWRYAPFALMGAMRWRTSALGDERYDDQITQELSYFAEKVADERTLRRMPSYGIGPLIAGFALASECFDSTDYLSTATELYEHSASRFDFTDAEDTLLLYGWSYLYEVAPSEGLEEDIHDTLWKINERLTPEGIFEFENVTTRRHQNQMYTLWGLCRAIEVVDARGYLDSAERVLDYTIRNRMREDGAFLWDDVSGRTRITGALRERLTGRPPYWNFLYECHQTFFVNAVAHYYRAGGERNYDPFVGKAMAWIYGDNELGVDLVDVSDIGVPMRFMTTDGRLDAPAYLRNARDQRYKGAYEVGSYVMALTHLLENTFPSGEITREEQRTGTTKSVSHLF